MRKKKSRIVLKIIGSIGAFAAAWMFNYWQGAPLMEAQYLLSLPFQSQNQLLIEDRLANARILELEQKIVELEQQNKQVTELLQKVNPKLQSDLIAPIIGRNVDSWWNQVTLGKGSSDGVKPGFIVLGVGGIVGRITTVTKHTSRVILISDPNSRVGVTVSRSRNLGYLRGKNSQSAIMHFFSKPPDVKKGDLIATSPIGNLYPTGIVIGSVTAINKDKKSTPEAEIALSAPIDILEWVVIRAFQPKLG